MCLQPSVEPVDGLMVTYLVVVWFQLSVELVDELTVTYLVVV